MTTWRAVGGHPGARRLAEIVERAGDPFVIFDLASNIEYANDAVRVLGWEPEQLVGRSGLDLAAPEETERASRALGAIAGGHPLPSSAPYRVLTGDGGRIECDIAPWVLGDPAEPSGIACHIRPTQDSRVLRSLLHRLLDGDPSRAVLTEMLGLLYHRNEHARVLVVFDDEDDVRQVVGDDLDPVLGGLDAQAGSPWDRAAATGEQVLVESRSDLPVEVVAAAEAAGLRDCWVVPVGPAGAPVALITEWTSDDGPPPQLDSYSIELLAQLTELVLRWRHQVRDLERAATRDPLTGLPNRRALDEFDATGPRRDVGVLYIDLDRFKPVNDRLGHAAGDLVLRTVANRLLGAVRPTDIVARLGGDEFGIVCPGCSATELGALADRVHSLLAEPIAIHGDLVAIGSSIGVVLDHDSVRPLLERADEALYSAKVSGRSAIRWAPER